MGLRACPMDSDTQHYLTDSALVRGGTSIGGGVVATVTCIGGGVVPTDGAQSVDEDLWLLVAVFRARSLKGRHKTDPEIRITRSSIPQWDIEVRQAE